MARLFDDASSQYLTSTNGIVADSPFTIAGWLNKDAVADTNFTLFQQNDGSSSNFAWVASVRNNHPTNPNEIIFQTRRATGTIFNIFTTTTTSTNTWHHLLARCDSGNNGAVLLDASGKGTGTVSQPASTSESFVASWDGTSDFHSGSIAELAVWDTDLTDAEASVLTSGYSPLMVRPASLVAYWPLIGRLSPEIDRVGGYHMTLTNSPTTAAHPRIIYPPPPSNIFPASVAPADLNIDRSHTNFDNWTRGVQIA